MEVTFESLKRARAKYASTIVSVRDGPDGMYVPPWWDRLYWHFAYHEFGHVSAKWVVENAKSGDYLVMGAANATAWLQRVTGSTVTHVVGIMRDERTGYTYAVQDSMHSNNVDLVTGKMRGGAIICDLYTYIAEYADCYGYLYYRSVGLEDAQRRRFEQEAMRIVSERVEEPYNDNSLQLLSAANPWIARYIASFPFLEPLGHWLNPDNHAMFCSDLLARIYIQAGILHPYPTAEMHQPRDFFEPMCVSWIEMPKLAPLRRVMPAPYDVAFWKRRSKKLHEELPAEPSLLASAARATGRALLSGAEAVVTFFAPA